MPVQRPMSSDLGDTLADEQAGVDIRGTEIEQDMLQQLWVKVGQIWSISWAVSLTHKCPS